jgi:hypothetical protein
MAVTLRRPGRRTVEGVALATAVVTIAGLAIIAPGFDATRTAVDDGAVWAIQSNDTVVRYGRVNVEIAELDIIRPVDAPSAVLQSPEGAIVFTSNYARYAQVSAAAVRDLPADAPELIDSPAGTRSAQAVDGRVLLHTSSGEVFLTRIGAPADETAQRVELATDGPEAEPAPWVVDVVSLAPGGRAVGWNAEASRVEIIDLESGTITETSELPPEVAPGIEAQISLIGDRWVVLDPAEGALIIHGRESEPSALSLDGVAALQRPSVTGDAALVSDENGLLEVPLDGAGAVRIVDRPLGVPATPTELDGVLWAAWLAPGSVGGGLWNSETGGFSTLDYAGQDIGEEPRPALQTTGRRMALNDLVSGWIWTIPDGALVPSSQDWTQGEQDQEEEQDNDQVVAAAVDPKPPVVVDDAFGVRPGAVATLPLLLNDSDPNGDVLTIVPSSITGLDPSFGTVTTAADDQAAVIQVAPGASGRATFTYQAEDGTADGGLISERSALVTVTVVPDTQNSAPVWCGVESCTAEKPRVQLGPGSSVEIDWLRGWVDPEGDPIFVSQATVTDGLAVAAATDAGRILVRHTDPNDGGGRVALDIAVSDVRGAASAESFEVPVTSAPTIALQSFAVVARAGDPVEIDPRPYMSGGSGPLRVVEAIPAREGRGEVGLNPATGIMTFQAPTAGSYLVDWTVSDGVREQSATVRITLRDAGQQKLSVAPTIAFVRPQEDASVDVFSAVSNPAGAVLLLSNVSAEPAPGATLFASTVGRDLLRVSGSTATLQPGLLGNVSVTVSDGTGNPDATAQADVAVYLLPAPPAVAPIAIDDAVVVRAGDRVDVPVLDNDVAVQGNAIAFDPRGVQADAGLAFTTARTLRLLAPDEPGSYAVRYTIYSVGYPALTAVGTLQVTVLPSGPNSAPVPSTLIGRVISGGSVTIPFSSLGIDPDGDEVVLDSVVEQPQRGAARISSDGRSIVYTSVLGFAGEVSFTYRVRDTEGLTGDGVVRIGVLPTDEDPSPIAFSDYAQVTEGADSLVVVRPLQNDVDPARTRLTLLEGSPIPNVSTADGFEAERAAAQDRIVSVDGDAITFRAGTELGTFSYFYDVVNERGDVARGTIVIRVVRESVASVPIITDTVLTAENRDSFARGVDVVSGRVAWSGGDIGGLSLSLWQDIPGVTVRGTTISGPMPQSRLVIPFSLQGEDFQGEPVASYGFLVVPGPLDLPPAARTGSDTPEVQEREQVTLDIASLVAVPAGVTLELDPTAVRASGQRSTAECRASGDLSVVYVAGESAPWRDFCIVPVRFVGQSSFTYLSLPIRVIPGDPQPELRSAAIEVSPGDTVEYALRQMTTWQGDPQDDAVYRVGGATGSFEIIADASTQVLSVRALDAALPGTVEVASVSITNPEYEGVVPAGLTLRVGPAPATLPKGGTATQECGVSQNGTQCTIRVVGVSGEVNPLPRTPLVVTSVTQPQACPTVAFAVSGTDAITATWTQQTPGAVCAATFTVRDAQGRVSAADRDGAVILDFQGLPAAAGSVTQVAYGDGTATLAVTPGAASSSYPALTGFEIVRGGTVVATCSPLGECGSITGLENGAQLTYEAFAINAQGRALTAPQTLAWSYVPPPPPVQDGPARPTEPSNNNERLNWPGNLADIRLVDISPDTRAVSVSIGGTVIAEYPVSGSSFTLTRVPVSNSPQTVTLTAVSRFPVPVGTAPPGGSITVPNVHGIGTPTVVDPTVVFSGSGSTRQATASATATTNGAGSTVQYAFLRGNSEGQEPSCPNASNDADWTTASSANFSFTNNNQARSRLNYVFCVRSVDADGTPYGYTFQTVTRRFFVDPGAPSLTAATYSIDPPAVTASTITWSSVTAPTLSGPAPEGFELRFRVGSGSPSTVFPAGALPSSAVEAVLCEEGSDGECSSSTVLLSPAPGSLDRLMTLALEACVVDETQNPVVPSSIPVGVTVTPGVLSTSGSEVSFLLQVSTGGTPVEVTVTIPRCPGAPSPGGPEPEPPTP